jgi:hypothetical protein
MRAPNCKQHEETTDFQPTGRETLSNLQPRAGTKIFNMELVGILLTFPLSLYFNY